MNSSNYFPPSFILLQQEGHMLSSCLSSGLTDLRAAHVHNKGGIYSSLFNLSIGIERLLKAIVIMEHMLNNKLTVPTKKQLKAYGHNINDLYDTCKSIADKRNVKLRDRNALNNINQDILNLLNDYANTARYHNLDSLSQSHSNKDPLEHWGEIMIAILYKDVSENQRTKIISQASAIANAIGGITMTVRQGLDKRSLTTEESLVLPALHDQSTKHAVLRVITILTPFRELISTLSHEAYGLGGSQPPFPQMHEFIEWMWDDRQYVLRKKKWP